MRSPKTTARIAGVLYLLLALLGPFSMMYVWLLVKGVNPARLGSVSAAQPNLAH